MPPLDREHFPGVSYIAPEGHNSDEHRRLMEIFATTAGSQILAIVPPPDERKTSKRLGIFPRKRPQENPQSWHMFIPVEPGEIPQVRANECISAAMQTGILPSSVSIELKRMPRPYDIES